MSFGNDVISKAEIAKKAVRNFHRPKYLEILKKIEPLSKEGKTEIYIEAELGHPVIDMLKEDGFMLATGVKGWVISWY